MEIFARRLKELREERGLTQTALSFELGLYSRSTIANWEQNIQEPNIKILIMIAKFFNVSTDYLLGMSDKR